MKVSYNWLSSFIDKKIAPSVVADVLTKTGLEVEEQEVFHPIKGGLKGLVVGEVKEKWQHDNADKLNVTKVDVGGDTLLQIVCGAPNVDIGQKVIVATIGTILYSGEESFKIKKSKIRGVVSEGMICAEDEIGLGQGHDGIMVLDSNAPIGQTASDYFGLKEDIVFEIGLTPNRMDAMSHYGVARDFVASYKQQEIISLQANDFPVINGADSEEVNVVVDSNACKRFCGVVIDNVEIKESPSWMQDRLKAIGIQPKNNVVDITNYVMHNIGQPIHAFDWQHVKGTIEVKFANPGEKFTLLDGSEKTLSSKNLLIHNGEKTIAIAGVMGGKESGVSQSTSKIFIECACFEPVVIRKSAKSQGLNTDASFRYERGVDPTQTLLALQHTVELIKKLTGGKVVSKVVDTGYTHFPVEVSVSWNRMSSLIGNELPKDLVKDILTNLDFAILSEDAEAMLLEVPSYRLDVTREADVVEEVLRIYGYDNIVLPDLLQMTLPQKQKMPYDSTWKSIATSLTAQGFYEIMTNSLTKERYFSASNDLVRILNPLSNELGVMRQSLLFSALEVLVYNMNRKQDHLKVFEWGKVYRVGENGCEESHKVAITIVGDRSTASWTEQSSPVDLFYLKGVVSQLVEKSGNSLDKMECVSFESEVSKGIQFIKNDKTVIQIVEVASSVVDSFGIVKPVFYAEMDFKMLLKGKRKVRHESPSKFQSVRRDLSLLLDTEVSYSALQDAAFGVRNKLLKEVDLFDVYEGSKLPKGKKSYALSFVFSDPNKTLTDKQVDKVMDKLVSTYKELGAEIR